MQDSLDFSIIEHGSPAYEQACLLRDEMLRKPHGLSLFDEDLEVIEPSETDIAAYSKYVTVASKMENEIPIIALVYIERLLRKTGILINKYNWKRFLVVCLCVASKVWDDQAVWNVDYCQILKDLLVEDV